MTHVISSRYLEFVGSAPSAPTMICVQSAITVTNITCDIGFSVLTHQEVKGCYAGRCVKSVFLHLCSLSSVLSECLIGCRLNILCICGYIFTAHSIQYFVMKFF